MLSACGPSYCDECVNSQETFQVTSSTRLDWLIQVPNVFHSLEDNISIYFGGDLNDTPTALTGIRQYSMTISDGDEVLVQQDEMTLLTGNPNSGYEITIDVDNVRDQISKSIRLLTFDIKISTDSDQTCHLDYKIQYINCEKIDLEAFDLADCRTSCILRYVEYSECGICR